MPPKTLDKGFEVLISVIRELSAAKLTTLGSVINFRAVRGVLPRSLPGVLNVSAILLPSRQSVHRVKKTKKKDHDAYVSFSLKILAMCSLSHENSL